MNWYKSFNLPSSSTAAASTTDSTGGAVSFVVAGATTKISEAATSIDNVFGGGGPFVKIGANTPSFDQMKANAMQADAIFAGGTGSIVNSQIADDASKLAGAYSATAMKIAAGVQTINSNHIVSLQEVGVEDSSIVMFDIMPEIVESRTVEYEAVAPPQFVGAFQKYKGTASVQWSINATFAARNSNEATRNLEYLNRLRGWTMPFFGDNTNQFYPGKLGAPPPVLTFSGLRKSIIGPVPVVITALNWNWPQDVDYLPTYNQDDDGLYIPFPAIMTIAIQVVESFSVSQFNKFSLLDYRNGDMFGAFNTAVLKGSIDTADLGTPQAGV